MLHKTNIRNTVVQWRILIFIIIAYTVEVYIMVADGVHSDMGRTNRVKGEFNALKELVRVGTTTPSSQVTQPLFGSEDDGIRFKTANAVIVILCRNSDLQDMIGTMKTFEKRFNRYFMYPYVFLNNEKWDALFQRDISKLTSNPVQFGVISREHWDVPPHINLTLCEERMESLKHVMYGKSLKYRQMCRYYSGFFYRHPLVLAYEYYWRVEPGTRLLCDLKYDPFLFLKSRKIMYGFVVVLPEIRDTVTTLVNVTMEHVMLTRFTSLPLTMRYFFTAKHEYNLCHFWSNFEIANFAFLRSKEYEAYFQHLDQSGGFFYERWGDAPVHSLAAGLLLEPHEVHYFDDIGYEHPPFNNCPVDAKYRKCDCKHSESFPVGTVFRGLCSQRYNQVRGQFNSMATIKDYWD